MEASSSPQDVVGDHPLGVMVDPEEDELELWEFYGKHRTSEVTSLVLSTTSYQTPPSGTQSFEAKQDDEDAVECIICLVPLEMGDRIGKLPCRHLMHVECLKTWLQRQNACPMCKRLKIAQPRCDDKNDKVKIRRNDELFNTRSTERFFRTDDLIRDSEETTDSVQGSAALEPGEQVDDDQSIHEQDGNITTPRDCPEGPRQPVQDIDQEEEDRLNAPSVASRPDESIQDGM